MPRDINGNTSPLPGTLVNTGDTVLPSQHNPMVNDVYAMMAQSLSRDGQGGMRAPLNMGTYPINNVREATNGSDAVTLAQVLSLVSIDVGVVLDYAGPVAPTGWAFPYGQAVSRAANPRLFDLIGTTYGPGDGATTFNLPDLRGRVVAGKDDMGGTSSGRLSGFFGSLATTLGGAFGAASHILTQAQMPSHGHGVNDPGHRHTVERYGLFQNLAGGGVTAWVGTGSGTTGTATTGVTVQATGGSEAHTNTQPTIVLNKIIKMG